MSAVCRIMAADAHPDPPRRRDRRSPQADRRPHPERGRPPPRDRGGTPQLEAASAPFLEVATSEEFVPFLTTITCASHIAHRTIEQRLPTPVISAVGPTLIGHVDGSG